MAAGNKRFSLVRVSRQNLIRNHANDNSIQPEFDAPINQDKSLEKFNLNRKEINVRGDPSRTKIDLTTVLKVPRLSVIKVDEPTSKNTHRHSVIIQPRPSLAGQQRNQIQTWIKRSSQNITRPELNWKGTNQWSYGVFSCCNDLNMCCYACACWCCFRHEISAMMGEHWCLWFLNCAPLMELRTKFRQQYAIQGSIAQDFCCGIFCPICIAMQLANEGRDRGHRIFN